MPDDFGFVSGCAELGVFDGEDAGEFLILDVNSCDGGGQDGLVGMREQKDGFGLMVDVFGCEAGVVLGEVDDGVFAGDVGGGDDGELGPVDGGVECDGSDAAAGDGGADGGSVPHAGQGNVVDILGAARDFGAALFANGGCADDGAGFRHRDQTVSDIQ